MEITICRITLHENLFYSTREIGRLYETGRYLHNYGLSYALGLSVSAYFNDGAIPRYQEELPELNDQLIYVTPAKPLAVAYQLNTFKYADNRYRVKMELSSRNTPSFGRAKELAVGSTFEFAVISRHEWQAPCWIRLGKWMSKAAVEVVSRETISKASYGEFLAEFPINPLDLPSDCQPITYDLVSMPPASLLDNAQLRGRHYRLSEKRCILQDWPIGFQKFDD
ncbi:MAG: type I-D CRISPR-associated protein Cas5/Csc1 [Caldilineaceae bacterium]|nr:type I-D CRISPR-associated protein Cas5/Csc1 [Caldilineaceae bacterium]